MSEPTLQPTAGKPRPQRRVLAVTAGVLGVSLITMLLLAFLFWVPPWLYPPVPDTALPGVAVDRRQELQDARMTLQNGVRTSLIQGLSALLVLTGAGVGAAVTLKASLRQVGATRDQIRETARASQEQLALAEQGQLTDRYTKAVDQLGSKELDVRLGGIFALERIARDSRGDQAMIYTVLSAYVRGRSPWPPRLPGQYVADAPPIKVPDLRVRAADLQAGLTVLGRRPVPAPGQLPDPTMLEPLDLSQTDLRCADLAGAHLHGVWLHRSRLQGSTLLDAQLQGAQLILADLQEAVLGGAQLQGADLTRANLRDADLSDANLEGADISGATLQGAKANQATHWADGWDPERAKAAGVEFVDDSAT